MKSYQRYQGQGILTQKRVKFHHLWKVIRNKLERLDIYIIEIIISEAEIALNLVAIKVKHLQLISYSACLSWFFVYQGKNPSKLRVFLASLLDKFPCISLDTALAHSV